MNLPDSVLLKIFQMLPTRDFIRLGCVDQQFRKISIEVMSRIKSIDLDDEIFRHQHAVFLGTNEITPEQLGWLFEKCEKGLEKVKFRSYRHEFIEIFENFSFPKLVELDLADNDVRLYQFWKMMRQNRNLEILKCGGR